MESSKESAAKKIHRDLNPGKDLAHNQGQPKQAPYSREASKAARFLTNCEAEHKDSLQCIERNYDNRGACEPFFEAYKTCRKAEHDAIRKKNAEKSGGGWFW